ncbi:hypothetical protein ACCAA_670018 [Candidatus Accumulibacter aalborgensis]|uniref:Uncharacterized protein n=1 Tax=Candidatus Accumulibacter aalborgensis TaxID=1860102 RepID=A0A1A8XVN0_9PROT|nr:hypothetical protein [Candidatus Accumulibacter aalborgensis]SBT09080.1 hypothetical protein ACCAA_670018 [Candidatus Accumulibacter aalborgensis]
MKHRLAQNNAQGDAVAVLPVTTVPGRMVRRLTPDQRSADIKAFGREIRDSKQSAAEFLRRAGLIDDCGQLTEPYRR